MKPMYKRDLNSNYLVLQGSVEDGDNYQVKMIGVNRIRGIIPMQNKVVDGDSQYYYEIGGKESLKSIYSEDKLDSGRLKGIIIELNDILMEAKEYMLSVDNLILDPEYIFYDYDTEKLEVIFYPNKEKEDESQFEILAEFFLNSVDHGDDIAISIAYQFYKLIKNENFQINQILSFIQGRNREKSVVNNIADKGENISAVNEGACCYMCEEECGNVEKSHYMSRKKSGAKGMFFYGCIVAVIGLIINIVFPYYSFECTIIYAIAGIIWGITYLIFAKGKLEYNAANWDVIASENK